MHFNHGLPPSKTWASLGTMYSSTADSHTYSNKGSVTCIRGTTVHNAAMPVDTILLSFVRHSCSHGTAVHDASIDQPCSLILSLSPLSPLSLVLDDPSVLALRLPPASYSSLEVMYTAVLATIYMCSQHGISLQLSCKPAESFPPHVPHMVLRSESSALPFDLWQQNER
jgi:hypothetical protein